MVTSSTQVSYFLESNLSLWATDLCTLRRVVDNGIRSDFRKYATCRLFVRHLPCIDMHRWRFPGTSCDWFVTLTDECDRPSDTWIP
jgi:hypothetical protein